MVKVITAGLAAAHDADVTELALCVEIERDDGRVYRMTNHDTDLIVSGRTYRSDIPFSISSISSTAGLAVDNTELTLALDGVLFVPADFQNGAFRNAQVTVFTTKFTDTSVGRLVVRKGWFGETEFNQHGHVAVTIVGLLKVLDLMVGRLYQPACDADLGDKRCRVAIDNGQARAFDNVYRVGDWAYVYNTASMTALSITNGDFETDGERTINQTITGWTKSSPAAWIVTASLLGMSDYTLDGGLRSLFGTTFVGDQDVEQFVYQDLDLSVDMSVADIDAGKLSCLFSVAMGCNTGTTHKPRLRVEFMNAAGEIIDRKDTRYVSLYEEDRWERHHVGGPIIAGSRTARVYLYAYVPPSGTSSRAAFDDVQGWYWNHTAGNPNSDVIHKVARIFSTATAIDVWPGEPNSPAVAGETYIKRPCNPSFETIGAVANSDGPTQFIGSNWIRANGASGGDYWRITNTLAGLGAPIGTYMLVGGDNGSGTQSTYGAYQNMNLLTDWGIDSADVDLGVYVGLFSMTNVFGDATSAVRAQLVWKDSVNAVISTSTVIDWTADAGAPVERELTGKFAVPANTRSVDVYLWARSPVGSGNAQVGFDDIKLYILSACGASNQDLEFGVGEAGTVFDYTAGGYTFDGALIWKAHTHHIAYDVVASVTDSKRFAATNLVGSDGAHNTALIRWISGNNAGKKNVIRTWTETGKGIKTYFDQVANIQVGDRFQIIAPCFHRFTEDCVVRFDNPINFRGFPFLPGRRG